MPIFECVPSSCGSCPRTVTGIPRTSWHFNRVPTQRHQNMHILDIKRETAHNLVNIGRLLVDRVVEYIEPMLGMPSKSEYAVRAGCLCDKCSVSECVLYARE